jgi:hypothetical protein
MVAVKQMVTVQAGGRIEVTSPELLPGAQAEVIVIMAEQPAAGAAATRPKLTDEEYREANRKLERFLGAVNSGDPRSGDNDRIDADLAREYGRGLDKES